MEGNCPARHLGYTDLQREALLQATMDRPEIDLSQQGNVNIDRDVDIERGDIEGARNLLTMFVCQKRSKTASMSAPGITYMQNTEEGYIEWQSAKLLISQLDHMSDVLVNNMLICPVRGR